MVSVPRTAACPRSPSATSRYRNWQWTADRERREATKICPSSPPAPRRWKANRRPCFPGRALPAYLTDLACQPRIETGWTPILTLSGRIHARPRQHRFPELPLASYPPNRTEDRNQHRQQHVQALSVPAVGLAEPGAGSATNFSITNATPCLPNSLASTSAKNNHLADTPSAPCGVLHPPKKPRIDRPMNEQAPSLKAFLLFHALFGPEMPLPCTPQSARPSPTHVKAPHRQPTPSFCIAWEPDSHLHASTISHIPKMGIRNPSPPALISGSTQINHQPIDTTSLLDTRLPVQGGYLPILGFPAVRGDENRAPHPSA
jgi:hypothetical protein